MRNINKIMLSIIINVTIMGIIAMIFGYYMSIGDINTSLLIIFLMAVILFTIGIIGD